jgi:hypothetical protein
MLTQLQSFRKSPYSPKYNPPAGSELHANCNQCVNVLVLSMYVYLIHDEAAQYSTGLAHL